MTGRLVALAQDTLDAWAEEGAELCPGDHGEVIAVTVEDGRTVVYFEDGAALTITVTVRA